MTHPIYIKRSVKEKLPEKGHYITNVGHDVAFNPLTGNWFVGRTIRRVDWWLEEVPLEEYLKEIKYKPIK